MKFYRTSKSNYYKTGSGFWINTQDYKEFSKYYKGYGTSPEIGELETDKKKLRELHLIYYQGEITIACLVIVGILALVLIRHGINAVFKFDCIDQEVSKWENSEGNTVAGSYKVTCSEPNISFRVNDDKNLETDGSYSKSYLPENTMSNYEKIKEGVD